MSDELNPYPGNLKHHKVDLATYGVLCLMLMDAVVELQAQYAKDTGRETSTGNEALKAAIAQGFKL